MHDRKSSPKPKVFNSVLHLEISDFIVQQSSVSGKEEKSRKRETAQGEKGGRASPSSSPFCYLLLLPNDSKQTSV